MPGMTQLPPFGVDAGFTRWTFSPVITAILVVLAVAYGVGLLRVRAAGVTWSGRRTLCYAAGLLVLLGVTQSGIGTYSHHIFWVHMISHLGLIMVAPALLVAGAPLRLLARSDASRAALHSAPVSAITNPFVVAVLYTVVVLITHLTGLMGQLMGSAAGRVGEQLMYLVAGYLYFLVAVGDEPIRWRLSYPMRIALLFVSMPVDTFTGVALLQSGSSTGGIPASQLHSGGAAMWIGGDLIMVVAVLAVFCAWAARSGTAEDSAGGWLESARASVFTERTGGRAAVGPDGAASLDSDDEQLSAYNTWLAGLDRHSSPDR